MQENEQITNSGRRRLAKGVLAGPAVLASITSKNALGASYACAVSGQQSGNLSRGTTALNQAGCVAGFKSRDDWCAEFSASKESKKTAAPSVLGVKYTRPGTQFMSPATSYQIYTNQSGLVYPGRADNQLVQAALTVYLNATTNGNYHVKPDMCLMVFNAAASGETLDNGHRKSWDSTKCGNYLKTLAGMGSYAV